MNATLLKCAGLVLAATLAAAPAAITAQVPTISIPYADLNLTTAAGVNTLDARVKRAAAKLCLDPGSPSLEVRMVRSHCLRRVITSARAQMGKAIDSQRQAQTASRSTTTETTDKKGL